MGDFNQFNPGNLCTSFKLKKLVTQPTRGTNTLDQVYSTLHDLYSNAQILPPIGMSDHSSVFLCPVGFPTSSHPTSRSLKRICRPENKQTLSSSLSSINWSPLYHTSSTLDMFNMFSSVLTEKMDICLPLRSVKIYPKDKPWMNADIKESIAKRQRAWSKHQTSDYNFYRNKVKKACSRAQRSFYNSMVNNTQDINPKKWWNNVKLLAGLSKSQPLSSLPHNGSIVRGQDLVDHIADSFCKTAEDIPPLVSLHLKFRPFLIRILLLQLKWNHLLKIKVQKSTGPDDIPNWLLKSNANSLCSPIASIFNASILQGSVPLLWKCADVLPLPKVPKPKLADKDLRPISLTPVLSKILENFIFNWIFERISSHIDPNQYGNIKKCSTTHLLIHLIHNWLSATDTPQTIIRSCMIDFSKAFDRIDHNILLRKLQSFDVPPFLINWCADFLRCRLLRVKLGTFKSPWKTIHAGVPQGTKLGPLFFLIMINDLSSNLPMYKYVDDCTVYEIVTPHQSSSLQMELNSFCNWTATNNMRLNIIKTKELRISFLKQDISLTCLTANNTPIEKVSSFKLLGVIISSNLTWHQHVVYICGKASKRLYSLRILKRSGVPTKDLILIFCTFVRPTLEYACQVWHSSLPEFLSDQIEQIQKRALKNIVPSLSYSEALEVLNLPTLHHRRETLCHSLYKSVLHPSNKLNDLLPAPNVHRYSLRNPRTLPLIKCRTNRFSNSFIPYAVKKWDSCISH